MSKGNGSLNKQIKPPFVGEHAFPLSDFANRLMLQYIPKKAIFVRETDSSGLSCCCMSNSCITHTLIYAQTHVVFELNLIINSHF